MKKIYLICLIGLVSIGCKESKSDSPVVAEETEALGNYEAMFIDVQNTEIPADIDPNLRMEKQLMVNINLTQPEQFWNEKQDFAMFAMGSIKVPASGTYYFRIKSTGKIQFKLDNKDLIVNNTIHDSEVNQGQTYLEAGSRIFEYEYYPANKSPYLVLEWSTDGTNYELVPDSVFDNLDAFTLPNWVEDTSEEDVAKIADNTLSKEEKAAGWKLLFDGTTTDGWHTFNHPDMIGKKWKAEDGALVFEGRDRFEFYVGGRKIELGPTDKVADGGRGIVTDDAFENFELKLDWWISEAGNNGIFYTVQEGEQYEEVWKTSPEMQVMDNLKHKDGLISKHRAGDLYDLIASNPNRVKKQGAWNRVRIVKNQGKIEHWLNGTKILSYDVNSAAWKDMISKSKFKDLTEYANAGPGKIGFQDHDNEVRFKNIKLKELE